MKKRRELDALVTNGKLPRRKSKSGHELLRSNDSDSSEVEEFSVSMCTKPSKKWMGSYPCPSCIVMLIFIVMTSSLIACGGLLWMHFELKRDFDNLSARLYKVETRNEGTPEEFQKYHSRLQSMNKTVQDMRVGAHGIANLNKNITVISKQLAALSVTAKGLQSSLQTAPQLKDLPKQYSSLTSIVVGIGSDIENAKTQLNSLKDFQTLTVSQLDDIKKRIEDMEKNPAAASQGITTSAPDGREHGSQAHLAIDNSLIDVKEVVKSLQLDIASVNGSFSSRLDLLDKTLDKQQDRMVVLENFTSQLFSKNEEAMASLVENSPKITEGEIPSMSVKGLVDKIANLSAIVASLKMTYQQLQDNIAYINASHSSITLDHEGMPQDFSLFKANTLGSFVHLNSSFLSLSEHVERLGKKVTSSQVQMTSINTHIDGILRFLGRQFPLETDLNLTVTTPVPSTTTLRQAIDKISSTLFAVTTPSPARSVTVIKIKNINDIKDLTDNFHIWDVNGAGIVDPADLEQYMLDPPTADQLQPFDVNQDGKYTLEELAHALGFTLEAETKPTEPLK